jgi:hypothetical protein
VGAPRGRGRRGGEGGRWWVPLVVVLIAIGAEVARRLPPRHAADRLRLAKPSDHHATAYRWPPFVSLHPSLWSLWAALTRLAGFAFQP